MSRKNKIDEQTRKAWADAAAQAAKIRYEEERIAKMAHVTIHVGARRSCHFYPAAPLTDWRDMPGRYPAEKGAELAKRRAAQQELQLAADAAIYRSPLDTKPVRPRKMGKPLAACEAAGKRAIGADDRKEPRRPVAVAIYYTTEGGDRVAAIFGGLTAFQADAALSGCDGITISATNADAAVAIGNLNGRRVVIWPSEAARRGAATVCTVDADATRDELLAAYPVIAERPVEVQAAIDADREREIAARAAWTRDHFAIVSVAA